jgi:outer membrane receptor protein involved in Fe transport
VGVFATLNYSNATKNKDSQVTKYSGTKGNLVNNGIDYNKLETTNTVDLGGLFSIGTVLNEKHDLQFTSLLIRSTDKKSAAKKGLISTEHAAGEEYSLSWTEQQLTNYALHGQHKGMDDKLLFNWDVSTSEAERTEPDFRYYQLFIDSGNMLFAQDSDVFFQPNKLIDEADDLSLSLSYDFDVNGNSLKVETGYAKTSRSRDYNARILRYAVGNETGGYPIEAFIVEGVDTSVDNVFVSGSGQNLSSGNLFELRNIFNNGYEAEQDLSAMYMMFDYGTEKYDLNLGARYEKNEVSISSIFQGAPQTGSINDSDLLPSLNFKYKAIEKNQFRAGYSRTLNRPSFNEISNVPLQTLKGDPFYTGSKNISQATIENYDLRWEYFFNEDGGSNSFALSFFYKSIDKPIGAYETNAPDTTQYQYGNAKEAELKGIEIDIRSNMDFMKDAWKDYYTSLNYTFVQSEVDGFISSSFASAGSINPPDDGQPLSGQAENVLNLALGYDNPNNGINSALLFNFVDERVISLAESGRANTILEPTLQLDFVFGMKIKEKYSLKAKIQNILNEKNEMTQDGKTVLIYERGIDFSLSFGVSL